MHDLIFGLIWTLFFVAIAAFTMTPLSSGGLINLVSGKEMAISSLIQIIIPISFFLPFFLMGFFLIYRGIKKIIANTKTELNGVIGYGKILRIYPTGTTLNGDKEMQAKVIVFIPSLHETYEITESIGFSKKASKYRVGQFVEVKYFDSDINFEKIIEKERLPYGYEERLELPIEEVEDDENNTIIINGVEYIKKDNLKNLPK